MPQALLLKDLDYSILQQCMHCGMCLPTCPTYDATKLERNSPRGRIALMRAIADDRLDPIDAPCAQRAAGRPDTPDTQTFIHLTTERPSI